MLENTTLNKKRVRKVERRQEERKQGESLLLHGDKLLFQRSKSQVSLHSVGSVDRIEEFQVLLA